MCDYIYILLLLKNAGVGWWVGEMLGRKGSMGHGDWGGNRNEYVEVRRVGVDTK